MNEILEKVKKYSKTPEEFSKIQQNVRVKSGTDLEKLFEFELNRAGGNFTLAGSDQEVAKTITHIIKEHNSDSAAISGDLEDSLINSIKESNNAVKFSSIDSILQEQDPKNSLAKFHVAISKADYLIAETGSIVLKAKRKEGRMLSILTPINIIIAKRESILPDMYAFLGEENSDLTKFRSSSAYIFITGPSRTADIEKILIIGVHGPKELFVILQNY